MQVLVVLFLLFPDLHLVFLDLLDLDLDLFLLRSSSSFSSSYHPRHRHHYSSSIQFTAGKHNGVVYCDLARI